MQRIFLIVSTIAIAIVIALLLRQPATAQWSQPRQVATLTATKDYAADCEALRTKLKATAEATAQAAPKGTEPAKSEIARPSNPGGPGPAMQLIGDPDKGAKIFVDNCQKCHGEKGEGGIENPGSDDGKVPALNPIDETLTDVDPKVYACNIDLFIEHGSMPTGPDPKNDMAAWGDVKILTPQQIADVIAYVVSLNPKTAATPTAP